MKIIPIYKSENFVVLTQDMPHVSREDGGHIKVEPKVRVEKRQDLSPQFAIEMAWLIMLAGEAFTVAMNNRGVDIGRLNYQDMGNWEVFKPEGPHLHTQIYGRAKSAKIQKYGDAVNLPHRNTGFYEGFVPLNDGDIAEIQKQIDILLKNDRYRLEHWGLR